MNNDAPGHWASAHFGHWLAERELSLMGRASCYLFIVAVAFSTAAAAAVADSKALRQLNTRRTSSIEHSPRVALPQPSRAGHYVMNLNRSRGATLHTQYTIQVN